jgi:hypothetical protein
MMLLLPPPVLVRLSRRRNWSSPVLVPTALEPLFPFGGLAKTELSKRGGTVMRIFMLAALLIAAFSLPAHAVEPVKSAAKGTATVAKGAAKGTATVAKGAAKGTAAAGRGVAQGARCVATLFHRC